MAMAGPCNCGRIPAKKQPVAPHGRDDRVNIFKKLQHREISSKPHRVYSKRFHKERFRDFRIQEEYDTYYPAAMSDRYKVSMIVSAKNIIFVLVGSGYFCFAYGRETNRLLCTLNGGPHRCIQTLHYNKSSDSVITVSCALDETLECRSTSIRSIQSGTPEPGPPIFDSAQLKSPAIVHFCDENEKALIFFEEDRIYKVFDLKNYEMLYVIPAENLDGIKINQTGMMLLTFARANGHVPLKILSVEDGAVLKSFKYRLLRDKKPVFIELCDEKILVKEENVNLHILNVFNNQVTEILTTHLMSPPRIIFLPRNQLYLTVKNNVLAVWDLQSGDVELTPFEDHMLWHSDKNMCITRDEDLIISYCKTNPYYQRRLEGNSSAINISNILTGKSVAKIKATEDCHCSHSYCNSSKSIQASRINSTVAEALEGITAISYDEDRNEIYTANKDGKVHVWSN